jgi:hypothetical protein
MQNELVSIRRPAVDLQEVIENKTEVIAELNTRFAKEEEAAAAAEEEAIARVVYEDDFPKETAPVVEDKVAAPVVEESDYETDGEDSDVEDEVAAPAPQQPRGIGRHLTVQNAALGVLATGVAVGAGVGGYMTCGPDMCVSVGLAAGRVALAGVGLPV